MPCTVQLNPDVVQPRPPGDALTAYSTIGLRPSLEGAPHVTAAEPSPAVEDENVAEPSTEYHEASPDYQDYDQPVVDDGYVDEPYQDERLRDGVDNVPGPGEVRHPAARGR